MNEVVRLERHDVVAIVTVDSPPVNALSAAVRGGIMDCVKRAIADPEVKAIVLTCAGRTFIAGADITEFGKPPSSSEPSRRAATRSKVRQSPWWQPFTAPRSAAASKSRSPAIIGSRPRMRGSVCRK